MSAPSPSSSSPLSSPSTKSLSCQDHDQQQEHNNNKSNNVSDVDNVVNVDNSDQFSLLYASYFFAAWGDRMWEFAAIVFLMDLFPTTLFPSSLFGFSENLAGIVCGGAVGRFIDFNDRLTVIRTSIIGQNVVILGASIVFSIALGRTVLSSSSPSSSSATSASSPSTPSSTLAATESSSSSSSSFIEFSSTLESNDYVTLALIVVAGMIAKVTSSMNKISIHKDWAVVLAAGNRQAQTTLNSNLRRCDLTCNILSPLAVGVISSWASPSFAVKFIALWSFWSLFIELYLAGRVYSTIIPLQTPKKSKAAAAAAAKSSDDGSSSSSPQQKFLSKLFSSNSGNNKSNEEATHTARDSLPEDSIYRAYLRHPIFPVSLAYAILYISSLSFGGIMVAYLRTLGCSDALLGLGRGIAAFVALCSTFAVPSMVKGLGLVNAGKVTTWLQVTALTPLAYVFGYSLLYPSDSLQETSKTVFIVVIFISICLSRFGLWGFDLCQTQLMQESVDPEYAGRVNGAQETCVNVCYLAGFVVTMVYDDPRHYGGPALVGFGSVVLCAVIFTLTAEDSSQRALELKKYVEEKKKEAAAEKENKKKVESFEEL